jgi:hypothetical protein
VTAAGAPFDLVRRRQGAERVTHVELFFDLVYVFAVTQLAPPCSSPGTPPSRSPCGDYLAGTERCLAG